MFSGIIKSIASVTSVQKSADGCVLQLSSDFLRRHRLQLGDSVAINGVCLTATAVAHDWFQADVSNTTLKLTNLANLAVKSEVNLEPALTLQEAVNGHLVSGHVDELIDVIGVEECGFSRKVTLRLPQPWQRYVVARGSVTLDGVSLTVNAVGDGWFNLTLVPHTLAQTTLQHWQMGVAVNLEIDMLARYLLATQSQR